MYLALITGVFVGFLSCVGSAAEDPNYDPCDQPIYTGPCNISFSRYLYNKESGQCEEVNGCQNVPIFISEGDCEVVCEDVCYKKIAHGNCTGYAYNKTTQQCEEFTNGVCDVNGNYFETEEECEEECENVCNKRIHSGSCMAYFPSWGYNKTARQCEFFVYGGCGGTANNFETEEKCEATCEDNPCKMEIDTGPCRASIPRYGYNRTIGQCVQFIYGGCKGNTNNFMTIQECENQCKDVCNRRIEIGNCTALFQRYGYNSATGQCEKFTYGGCNGNGNNFEFEGDCEEECEAGCDKPIDSGTCIGFLNRYAFNETSGQCQSFIYSGCEGNGNNYEIEEDCEAECES